METKVIHIRLREEEIIMLEHIAKQFGVTNTHCVRRLIREYFRSMK